IQPHPLFVFHGAGRDCAPLHQAGASTAISHLGLSGDADYLLIGDVFHDGLLAHQPSSAIAGGRFSDARRSHNLLYRPVRPGRACGPKSDSNKMNKLSLITAIVASLLSLAWRALTTRRGHSSLRRGRKDPADEASPRSPAPQEQCCVGIQSRDRVKGTKRTRITERVFISPGAIFSMTVSCCVASAGPSGMTSRPPTLSCSISGGGTCPSAAVTTIASNGPHSGQP